jgi:hypothetical protein
MLNDHDKVNTAGDGKRRFENCELRSFTMSAEDSSAGTVIAMDEIIVTVPTPVEETKAPAEGGEPAGTKL